MINKAILVGNLGRDPEIRSTAAGMPVANFSIATNRRWRDKEGNRQEQTEWHNIVCFGRQAEVAGQYLTRGRQIYVEGRLQTRSWEDRNTGETKYRTEIVCENFQMLGQRGDGGGGGGYSQQSYGGPPAGGGGQQAPASDFGPEPEDDDIPF
ncbi:MAG: single-stranded DNA-binding protein [Acidobacteriota bacterium]